jgi:hypothetical protein
MDGKKKQKNKTLLLQQRWQNFFNVLQGHVMKWNLSFVEIVVSGQNTVSCWVPVP